MFENVDGRTEADELSLTHSHWFTIFSAQS